MPNNFKEIFIMIDFMIMIIKFKNILQNKRLL